ncbi:hypothetical protein CEXT_804711 [Caerostris extrusa]|uniref:Uncharacterized protein n=1 Tax=Caerostris extrusa TaxID=172846 RepID=A0AAV4XZ96_CAEEX|nr:hypothetical protein CEXT_804711 [Caerostris extrusa]
MGKNALPMTPLFAFRLDASITPVNNGILRTWIWHVAVAIGSLFSGLSLLNTPVHCPLTPKRLYWHFRKKLWVFESNETIAFPFSWFQFGDTYDERTKDFPTFFSFYLFKSLLHFCLLSLYEE